MHLLLYLLSTCGFIYHSRFYTCSTQFSHTHTQKLALYDQYGRLMYGDAQKPRDVLEFVVFERHLANEYGKWRVHGKIKPDWSVSTEGSDVMKTIMIPYAEEDLKAKELLS